VGGPVACCGAFENVPRAHEEGAAAAGDPDLAFRDLAAFTKSIYEVPIPTQYDITIGGVGYPKNTNLYQVSRVPLLWPRCWNKPG
jgi:hypothetical protein